MSCIKPFETNLWWEIPPYTQYSMFLNCTKYKYTKNTVYTVYPGFIMPENIFIENVNYQHCDTSVNYISLASQLFSNFWVSPIFLLCIVGWDNNFRSPFFQYLAGFCLIKSWDKENTDSKEKSHLFLWHGILYLHLLCYFQIKTPCTVIGV